jgi:YHS domain-containing protein
MAIDPVCKMNLDEEKAIATSEYKVKKFYFCAIGCKKVFDENPEYYLSSENIQEGQGECVTGWETH